MHSCSRVRSAIDSVIFDRRTPNPSPAGVKCSDRLRVLAPVTGTAGRLGGLVAHAPAVAAVATVAMLGRLAVPLELALALAFTAQSPDSLESRVSLRRRSRLAGWLRRGERERDCDCVARLSSTLLRRRSRARASVMGRRGSRMSISCRIGTDASPCAAAYRTDSLRTCRQSSHE